MKKSEIIGKLSNLEGQTYMIRRMVGNAITDIDKLKSMWLKSNNPESKMTIAQLNQEISNAVKKFSIENNVKNIEIRVTTSVNITENKVLNVEPSIQTIIRD